MFSTFSLLVLLAASPDLMDAQARQRARQHHQAGEAFMTAERYDAAVEEFRKAVTLDPMLVLAHYNLGQSYMALKRYPEAVDAYAGAKESILRMAHLTETDRAERERSSREERQEIRTTIQGLSSGQIKSSQPQSMIVKLEERARMLESMELRGRDEVVKVPAEFDLALGSAYFRQQKLAEAEQAYSAAVRANRKLGAAYNNLAVIYMLTGRFADAHAAIRSAEQAGFTVSTQLKADLRQREAGVK